MLNHRISFVILSTALFLSGHAATLSGTVQDSANGSPLQGAIVSLRSGVQTLKIDTTDISGLFSLTTVDSGTYTIRTVKATYTTQNSTIHIDTTSQQSTVINLSITQYSTITGVITDSITKNPVAGARISLRVPLPATSAVGHANSQYPVG